LVVMMIWRPQGLLGREEIRYGNEEGEKA